MRLRQFLKENRSIEIDSEKGIDIINTKCKNALKSYKNGYRLYRGIRNTNEDFLYVDPKKGKPRTSRYASFNYYTILMDNLPSWKKYPKRSQSIICTTSFDKAYEYSSGSPYHVFPYDGANIASCPYGDVWDSFKIFDFDQYGDLFSNSNEFNMWINMIFFELFGKNNLSKNWNIFASYMNKFDKRYSKDSELLYYDFENKLMTDKYGTIKFFKQYYKGSLIKMFNKILDPKFNNFKLTKNLTRVPEDKEVWTDSECILVHNLVINDYIDSTLEPVETMAAMNTVQECPIENILINDRTIRTAYLDLLPKYIDSNKKLPTIFDTDQINEFKSRYKYIETGIYEPCLAIIRSLFLGKKTVSIDVRGYTELNYVSDQWKIQPQKKFLGLEDFTDKRGLEDDLENLKSKGLI